MDEAPKVSEKSFSYSGKNLVEQCKNLAFEIGGHVDDVKPLAA